MLTNWQQRKGHTPKKGQEGALKKLNVQPIQAIEEVNMFKADGNVIHFAAPKGIAVASFSSIIPHRLEYFGSFG
jgi:hypothetical protein